MALTPEQIWFFRHNGFLKIAGQLTESTVEKLRDTVHRDIREVEEPVRRAKDGTIHRLSKILDRDPIFWETATHPIVLDALESLLGPNIEVIRNRHNHVMLRTANAGFVYMHRDALSWTRSSVTVIFYLEETNLENGCTAIVPGTHLMPWLQLPLEANEKVIKMGLLDQVVRLPMPAGGLLILDSLVFHSQGTNYTDDSRMSMTLGYHSTNELSGVDDSKSTLVRGERIYKGNDGGR